MDNSSSRSAHVSVLSFAGGAAILSLYGTAHVVVDAICAAIVFGLVSAATVQPETFVALVVLYHVLAFGTQSLLGLVVDSTDSPRCFAAFGCLLTAGALLFTPSPMAALVLAGLGNAAFHVGGGAISLRLTPQRATAPGLFVAPGSLGLLLGAILGKTGQLANVPLLPIALLLCLLIVCTPIPKAETLGRTNKLPGRGELILGLVLLAIAVRSLLGFLVNFPWETQPLLLIALTLAAVFGKAVGGILADRYGWVRLGVGATIAALPFLAFGATHPIAAIPGILLLNLTMPVTLAATAEALPGRPGFAFGLTCLALLLGMLPSLLGISLSSPMLICLAILLATAALYRGLRILLCGHPFRKPLEVSI